MADHFSQHVPAGEPVKPWLILGPFFEDLSDRVQGLSFFENIGSNVGVAAMAELAEDARPVLLSSPQEGDTTTFRGQTQRWEFMRRPDNYLSWGNYYISNHMGAVFLSASVTPQSAGDKQWRFTSAMSIQFYVAINGKIVFDSSDQPFTRPYYGLSESISEYTFEAPLNEGENTITLGLFRIARMAQVGCWLALDDDVQVRAPLGDLVPAETRAQVEESLRSVRLDRDIVYPEQPVGFRLGAAPGEGITLQAQLIADTGEIVQETELTNPSEQVTICEGAAIPDGSYALHLKWIADDTPLTQTQYHLRKVSPVDPLPGLDQWDERTQIVLEHFRDNREARRVWPQLARYALGRYDEVDETEIRWVCEFIAARKDCADFVIQGLLRLMVWERKKQHLSPEINALMKDTVLGFKYWVDEPGDTVMYMGSENHRLLFHVAEWMAGQLFPTEEFTNSRQRGLYHATKGRMYITEWLRQRGRFGFDEWHSNSYYPICIAPLLNVYDFAIYEDDKLRQMAGGVLDYMFFNLAADSYQGMFGTTHGRSYGINIKYPDLEGTSASCWMAFGVGSLTKHTSGMSPVSLATSAYRVPPILADIATDDTTVIESFIRQGILKTSAPHADFCVYRTPDYLLSGLQDHRVGEFESSTHPAHVTLGNKTAIFWSCPHTSGEGSGLRPDYWSGNTTLPRVIQYRNVMALTYHLTPFNWMSHCFFEQPRFDEVRFAGNWAFGKVNDGYVAIYSENGLTISDEGQYAGRELQCAAPENTWLVECGRKADWNSFDAFVNALQAASVASENGVITYQSPTIGTFVTGWDVTPTVDGEAIKLHDYPMVESPWAYSRFGSGELTIRYGDAQYDIWFNQ
ncbi:MAG: hypothetical protein JXA10_11980 [Anaerolineae bacterium]|nr:hypothetical protein [Anaerolineae bacterium]